MLKNGIDIAALNLTNPQPHQLLMCGHSVEGSVRSAHCIDGYARIFHRCHTCDHTSVGTIFTDVLNDEEFAAMCKHYNIEN